MPGKFAFGLEQLQGAPRRGSIVSFEAGGYGGVQSWNLRRGQRG